MSAFQVAGPRAATPASRPCHEQSVVPSPSNARALDKPRNPAPTPQTGSDLEPIVVPVEIPFFENIGLPTHSPPSTPLPRNFPSMTSNDKPHDKSIFSTPIHRRGSQQHRPLQNWVPSPLPAPSSTQSAPVPSYFASLAPRNLDHSQAPVPPVPANSNLHASSSHGMVNAQSVFTGSPPPTPPYTSPSYLTRHSLSGPFPSPHPQQPLPTSPRQSFSYDPHTYPSHVAWPFDNGQYPQNLGYVPLAQHRPQPHYQRLHPQDGNPYQPSPHRPMSTQSVPTGPESPHTLTYPSPSHYLPPNYGSPSTPFPYPHYFQPNAYQWYYLPSPPAGRPYPESTHAQFPPHRIMNRCGNGHSVHASVETRNIIPEYRGSILPAQSSSAGNISQRKKSGVSQPLQSSALSPAPASPPKASPVPPAYDKLVTSSNSEAGATNPPALCTRIETGQSVVRRPYHPNPPANRSEWVMWVGNVPADATHEELWQFLKSTHTFESGSEGKIVEDNGIASVFLITRSNCAFVNFHTEEHLTRGIARFNGQQLRPHDRRCLRLVCKARRKEDDLRAGVGGQRGMGMHTDYIRKQRQQGHGRAQDLSALGSDRRPGVPDTNQAPRRSPLLPLSFLSDVETVIKSPTVKAQSISPCPSTDSSFLSRYFPKRFFILKSLTQADLDLSVERGLWTTQRHNEVILDQAYRTSKEVILIFGVNKSGEFYGYGRMASRILPNESSVSWPSGSGDHPLSYLASSGYDLVEHSPVPLSTLEGEPYGFSDSPSTIEEWRSAPARIGTAPWQFSVETPTARFSLGEKSRLASAPENPTVAFFGRIPQREIILDKNAPARAVRNKLVKEESKSKKLSLQSVEEENQGDSVGDNEEALDDTLQFRPAAQPGGHEGDWERAFKVEWLCTQRLPFYRVRHLRNPWNHDREIKVSRDGTELEVGVGQGLIEEWTALATIAPEGEGSAAVSH